MRENLIRSAAAQAAAAAFHLIYPVHCPFCDRILTGEEAERLVCADCCEKLQFAEDPCCMKCGRPLISSAEEFCPQCRTKRHYYVQARSLLIYQGDTGHSLNRLKSANRRDHAAFYAHYMAESYGGWMHERGIDTIVPVPLYPKKKRERGYNQAELLARRIAGETGIRMEEGILLKVQDTRQQKRLNAAERRENLRGAFAVRAVRRELPDGSSALVSTALGRRILLVDDIYTTGATADMASKVLLDAGAQAVYVLTAAIAHGA